jgi:phage tail tape-measure protein
MSISNSPSGVKAPPRDDEAMGVPRSRSNRERAESGGLGAASGAAAGAALGAFAGPSGAVAGAVLGALAGAATGIALVDDRDRQNRDSGFDDAIGVTGKTPLGAASPDAPKAVRGTYSGGSAGVDSRGSSDAAPSEGPMSQAG